MSFGVSVGDFLAVGKLANEIRKKFRGAPSQFRGIVEEIRSLSIVIGNIEVYISEQELSNKQLKDLQVVSNNCKIVLHDAEKTLEKYQGVEKADSNLKSKAKRVLKRLQWEPDDVRDLRSRIASNVTMLTTFLGLLTSKAQFATNQNMNQLVQQTEDSQRQAILNWLSATSYAQQQKDLINNRQEGTGQWLLDTSELKSFAANDNQTLFCPGIPGSGKTMLTTIVVDYLSSQFEHDDTVGLAYVYCNYKMQAEQTTTGLLASLLKQLCQGQPLILDCIKDLYERHRLEGTELSAEEVKTALRTMAARYSRILMIVDGLDECLQTNGCRESLLSSIFSLQEEHNINFFATSRFVPDIVSRFEGKSSLEIRASREDVKKYVQGYLMHLPSFVQRNVQLQEDITATISDAVDGMFLLAKLYLYSLEDKVSPKDVRNALKDFTRQAPGSGDDEKMQVLTNAYERTMERINEQRSGFKTLALQVLGWVTATIRPLTAEKLQNALAVEIGEPALDPENLPQIEDMISVCAGLVLVDQESGVIRLVHYTTQEYFNRTRNRWFPDIDCQITLKCVTYLSFTVFERGPLFDPIQTRERSLSNPFYVYAANAWGHHAHKAHEEDVVCQSILEFLGSDAKLRASLEVALWGIIFKEATGLHIAAHFGLNKVIEEMIENGAESDVNCKTGSSVSFCQNWTPLFYSIRSGYGTTVDLLISKGADIEPKDWCGFTPLSRAFYWDKRPIVDLLISKGANIEAKDERGYTSLFYASGKGKEVAWKVEMEHDVALLRRRIPCLRVLPAAFEKEFTSIYKLVECQHRVLAGAL